MKIKEIFNCIGSSINRISEIVEMPGREYSGSDDLDVANYRYKNLAWKKLPGENSFYYGVVETTNISSKIVKVLIADGKSSNKIVGVLTLITEHSDLINIYKKKTYSVHIIAVDKKYRNRGIAKSLYGLVLLPKPIGLDGILFAGSDQTPGGAAMWESLSRIPNVEVTGWVSFYSPNDTDDSKIEQLSQFIEKQGGSYFAHSSDKNVGNSTYYYEFEVSKIPGKRKLEAAAETAQVKVYSGYDTGLMANYLS
jgi:hypothetical protein